MPTIPRLAEPELIQFIHRHIAEGVWVADDQLRLLYVNDSFCRTLGIAPWQAIGEHVPRLFPGQEAAIDHLYDRVRASAGTTAFCWPMPDGSSYDARLQWTGRVFVGCALYTAPGARAGRKDDAPVRGPTRAMLAQAHAIAHVGTWMVERRSGHLWLSDEAAAVLGGRTGALATVEGMLGVLEPADRQRLHLALGTADDVPPAVAADVRWRDAEGTPRTIRLQGEPLAGDPSRLVGILQDVTSWRESERHLREAIARYELALQSDRQMFFFQVSATGTLLECSPTVEGVLGVRPERLVGRPVTDFLPNPEDGATFDAQCVEAAGLPGPTDRRTYVVRTRDGESRIIQTVLTAIAVRGTLSGYVGIAWDVTATSHRALRSHLHAVVADILNDQRGMGERLQDLAETLTDVAVQSCTIDLLGPDGGLTRAAGARVTAVLPPTLGGFADVAPLPVGQPVAGAVPPSEAMVQWLDVGTPPATPLEAYYHAEAAACGATRIGIVRMTHRGSVLGLLVITTAPIPRRGSGALDDDVLRTLGYRVAIAIATDRDAQARATAERRYRRLFAHHPLPGLVYDPTTLAIIEANDAMTRRYGWTPTDLRERTLADLATTPEHATLVRALTVGARADDGGAAADEVSTQHRTATGEILEVTITTLALDDRPDGLHLALIEDRTARVRAAALDDELQRRERLAVAGELASTVAHEVSHPLQSCMSLAHIIRATYGDALPADAQRQLSLLEDEAALAARTMRALLDTTRETGGGRERVDVAALVDRVLEARGYALRAVGIAVVRHLQSGLTPVYGDRAQLARVVLNLIENAKYVLRHVPGSRIEATVERRDDQVVMAIEDNGPGVAGDHATRIFERHFTTKPPGEGAGLGLAIAQAIVTDHGGAIAVTRGAAGGARFVVSLPIAPTHASARPSGRGPTPGA